MSDCYRPNLPDAVIVAIQADCKLSHTLPARQLTRAMIAERHGVTKSNVAAIAKSLKPVILCQCCKNPVERDALGFCKHSKTDADLCYRCWKIEDEWEVSTANPENHLKRATRNAFYWFSPESFVSTGHRRVGQNYAAVIA